MEITSNAEPKRSYSWWWDSHISPKNSKWLQDNLNDMDNKIKAMIKLIEEDADSFARRAEMYYKKRPDLMKLVEEFYRAYRALAERYDHVTGALRQAHKTIAVVFPNQIQLALPDEPPSGLLDTGDEHTYESGMQTKSNAIQWDGDSLDEIAPFISKEGLKSLNWLFVDEDAHKKFGEGLIKKSLDLKENEGKLFEYKKLEEEVSDMSKENKNLKNEITLETLRADKAEAELHCLKDAISKLKSELESAFLQYQISEERVSNLESELSVSQDKCLHLNDEINIKVSKLNITEEQCLCLERENTSLQFELDNLNLVVSKQQEEGSGLFKENQNLHNQVNSESKRADRAEADSTRLRDAILRLKSEMESALLQYRFSQERISDLEAEISLTKEQFKNINHEMAIRASKLNLAEDHCLLLQEENKSLQHELDKFMMKVTSQEKAIIKKEEELNNLRQSIEFERQQNVQAEIMEKSLRTQVNKLEQKVEMKEEEIAIREQEVNKFKQHIEDGRKDRLQFERAHEALVELHSQSQEKMKSLGLEIQNGADKLRKMEMSMAGLEEEIKHLRDENNDLNEENFSSVSKIICLQDEIVSLKESKHKIQDELRFNAEEKIFLQQELSSYKSIRNDLEEGQHDLMGKLRRMELREATFEEEMRSLHDENIGLYEKFFSFSSKIVNLQDDMICLRETNYRLEDELQFHLKEKMDLQKEVFSLKKEKNVLEEQHRELTENIEMANCNVTSLQLVVKEMLDENKELRNACNKLDDEKACHLEQLMLMESMADKNVFLESSLSDANAELKILFEKIKGLEEYFESLHENAHNHISSEQVQVSHFKPVTRDTVKHSGKHSVLDNISDLNFEFDVLREKVKALEEPCQSLYYQNSHLIAQNSNLVSQVERVGLHLQNLENRFVILEGKQVNIEEKDLALYNVQELHGNEELDNNICFSRNQMSDLSNQIHLLRKENQATKEELEEEYLKTVKSEIDNFIMTQFLVDLNETNLFLSKECRKYADKLDLAENFIFEFKQEWATQEMKLITMSDRNEKLLEGIHVMMKTCDTKRACDSYDAEKDSEISIDGYDNILHSTVGAAKGDIEYLKLEKPFPFTLLEQLALVLADLRQQKKVLEEESLLRNQEISILHERNHELTEINEQARKDINAGKQCEEMLTVEMERICVSLFELQETCHVSQSEILNLREKNELLSKKLHELRDQNDALKEENDGLLEKAITQEHLSLIFRSCNAEKSSDIDWLIRDVNCLYRITNDLDQEIRVINKNMRALEVENLQLKEEYRAHIVILENKIHQARSALRKHDKETETRKKLLEQRGMELYYASKKFLDFQSPELPLNPESMVGRGEWDEKKNFFSLFEENSCKDYEIGCLQKYNKMLEAELLKLHKVVETLITKEKNITSELQRSINESRTCKSESAELLHDLHTSSFMELIFKEKFFELMETFKDLGKVDIAQLEIPVEETALQNVQYEDLKEKLDVLGRENKGLKTELNAFAPLVVSLEKEITSLEEHTLSLTNLHILNSKRKQGNILTSLQHKKCSQARSKYQSPRSSAVILDLKKLRAKVKALQKEVTDTEGLLEQGQVVSGTNEKRKGKVFKPTGTPKKKDIILDMRKMDSTGKDVEQLKDGTPSRGKHEQMMKDIELDYVLSSSQREADFNGETDDHTLVVWDVERSENPSSELVLEKEMNVDNLGFPANYKESIKKWMDRLRESLSADAERLLGLEKSLEELKMKIATSEMEYHQPSASELNTVKQQVKDADETFKKLTDFNHKLAKMAEAFSLSSDSSKLRRKVLERVQRGAEKIEGLELKLQKVQSMLSKLQEEELENKAAKPVERRSKLPLKDLIYGKRSDPKQMKRRFCACMRFKTKEK